LKKLDSIFIFPFLDALYFNLMILFSFFSFAFIQLQLFFIPCHCCVLYWRSKCYYPVIWFLLTWLLVSHIRTSEMAKLMVNWNLRISQTCIRLV